LVDAPPSADFVGMPRLTVRMAARLQGFPDSWLFTGKKTSAYRQVGNAFPPPVAQAVGESVAAALEAASRKIVRKAG
jgi:DNA (cytosine-5)-methyltransferase 1